MSDQPGNATETIAAPTASAASMPRQCTGRVLLFGAYANGNIGDEYQANAVAYHLKRQMPGLKTYATSNSSARCSYEYDTQFRLDNPKAIADPAIVNEFDVLIIGGGGLLASIHRPLNSVTWLERIKIPIFLLAVGASEIVVAKCRALVERAAIVTARDSFSYEILAAVRPDVELLHDPILMDDRLNASLGRAKAELHRMCVIPRKQTEKNEPVYRSLGTVLNSRDKVVSVFPATDHGSGAISSFGKVRAVKTWKMAELVAAIDSSTDVVSERYHGCIVAMKRGIPSLGLINSEEQRRSKIGELYTQLNHGHLLLSYRNNPLSRAAIISKLENEFDESVVSTALASIRRVFDATLSSNFGKLGLK